MNYTEGGDKVGKKDTQERCSQLTDLKMCWIAPTNIVRNDGPGKGSNSNISDLLTTGYSQGSDHEGGLTIQNVARTERAEPLLSLGWNSPKYVQTTGILPPTLFLSPLDTFKIEGSCRVITVAVR